VYVYLWFNANKAKGVRRRKQNTIVMTIFFLSFYIAKRGFVTGICFLSTCFVGCYFLRRASPLAMWLRRDDLATGCFYAFSLPRGSIAFCIFWICSCFSYVTAPSLSVSCCPLYLDYRKPRRLLSYLLFAVPILTGVLLRVRLGCCCGCSIEK
jgi:hypothetical protein